MRAGSLDRTIVIQCQYVDGATSPDRYGATTGTWQRHARVRAQKLEHAVSNREGARGNTTEAGITFRIRWIPGVTLDHRVLFELRAFKIVGITEIGRRVGLDLMCERVGP